MTINVITLWYVHVTSLTASVSTMRFLLEIVSISKAINPILKGHMIGRILHSWSFHMKFMKLAFCAFHKYEMSTHVSSLFICPQVQRSRERILLSPCLFGVRSLKSSDAGVSP